MAIGSSSLVELWYVFEVSGAIPASPVWNPIRYSEGGNTLAFNATRISSDEVRGDRHRSADRRGTFSVGGDITAQLAYAALDDLFLAGFHGASWAPRATITAITISAALADSSFNDSGNGFTFVVADVVTVSGFSNAANNGQFKVATAAAGKITVTDLDGTAVVLVNESATPSITIAAQDRLIAGSARRTMAILERHTDLEIDYLYRGCEVNTVTIAGVSQEKWICTFGIIGNSQEELASLPGGSTFAAVTTSDFMTALDGAVGVAGTDFGVCTEFSASIENGIESKFAVARSSAIASVIAPITSGGSMSAYFDSETFYNRYLNDTQSKLVIEATDGANSYRLTQPASRFVEGSKQSVGTDVIVSLNYSAGYDGVELTETVLERF